MWVRCTTTSTAKSEHPWWIFAIIMSPPKLSAHKRWALLLYHSPRLRFCSWFVCRLCGLVTSTLTRINHVNPGCRKGPALASRGPGRRFESPLDHVYTPTTLPGILAAKRRVKWLTAKSICAMLVVKCIVFKFFTVERQNDICSAFTDMSN